MTFWQDYLSVQFDPAHLLSEFWFTIVFDVLLIGVGWKAIKALVARISHQEHTEHDDTETYGKHAAQLNGNHSEAPDFGPWYNTAFTTSRKKVPEGFNFIDD